MKNKLIHNNKYGEWYLFVFPRNHYDKYGEIACCYIWIFLKVLVMIYQWQYSMNGLMTYQTWKYMKQKNISLIDKFIGKLIIHEYKKNDIIYLIILSERDGRKDLYDVWDVTGGGYSLLPKSTVEDLYKANKLEVIG